jgi:hypothetical protein
MDSGRVPSREMNKCDTTCCGYPAATVGLLLSDIAFPEFIPGFVMKTNQALPAFQFGEDGHAFRFIQRVFMVSRSDRRAGNGIPIGLARLSALVAELHQVHIIIPHLVDHPRFLAMRSSLNKKVLDAHISNLPVGLFAER